MGKILNKILFVILAVFSLFIAYFFIGKAEPAEKIAWGVNFSQKHAELLGLDWQKAYLDILDDLRTKNIKIITHWDYLEPESGKYNFEDLDWQIDEAQKRGARIFLVIGIKTGHWPECHIPPWAEIQNPRPTSPASELAGGRAKSKIQNLVLEYLKTIVNRYKDNEAIWAWQVENEALFPFGECPEGVLNKIFLKKEIELVKSLDGKRPVIISDSGEFSFWITAAKLGDTVSTTLHRKVWFEEIKTYLAYPLKPVFYWRKYQIIKKLFGKEVFVGELQAEPWCPTFLIYDCPAEEQRKTMDLEQFKKNTAFASQTGLKEIYLWGTEWWLWMKEKQGSPEIWNEAKKLSNNNER